MFRLCFGAIKQSPILRAFCFLFLLFQMFASFRTPLLVKALQLCLSVFLSFSSTFFLLFLALKVVALDPV
jgi:hypothetical protein